MSKTPPFVVTLSTYSVPHYSPIGHTTRLEAFVLSFPLLIILGKLCALKKFFNEDCWGSSKLRMPFLELHVMDTELQMLGLRQS